VRFAPTGLPGAWVIELDRFEDDRGFFARSFCAREFAARGLLDVFVQCNVSFNRVRGTLRGMHYQAAPHAEVKLVRCTAGAIYDVIVDVRAGSATCGRWFGVELDAGSRRMLYVPAGFAHGFQTLRDDSEVFYQMGAYYEPDAQRGFRHDDATVGIAWPEPVTTISERDLALAGFAPEPGP
jgi:dTDP-4-dehydrorhamnose 3,5-epimerase